MTLQGKGFCLSAGIHAMLLLAFVLLQLLAAQESKVTVIDFTIDRDNETAAAKDALPRPAGTLKPAAASVLHAAAVKPRAVAAPRPKKLLQAEWSLSGQSPPLGESHATEGRELSAKSSGKSTEENHALPDGAGDPAQAAASNGTGGQTPEESRIVYLKEHFVYIRNIITGRIRYPETARRMGWCGQVKIAFVVCEDGGVDDVRVTDSSGFQLLDHNTVETVKHSAPFPRPPVKAEIRMAVTYRLN